MEKENGSCQMCSMHGTIGRNHWMHVVIKISIALIVFWAGVQFGELRATVRGGEYGYRMMGGYYGGQVNRGYYGPNMMYRNVQGTVAQPANTTATTTKK